MKLAPLIVKPAAFFELILQPSYADIAPDYTGAYSNTMSEWTLMDNVSLAKGARLIDIFKRQNFLKRKDRSCKTDYSKVAITGNRKLTVDELYGATEDCQEEFYADSMKDFRDQAPRFREITLGILKGGINVDVLCNSYFGDITRADDTTGVWSWNKFDGIFVKMAAYIADGTLPDEQVLAPLPSGVITPLQAYNALQAAYDAQSDLMQTLPDLEKAFYVDKRFAKAYERYLISTGNGSANSVMLIMNGVPVLQFENIPIYVEPMFNPILKALNGGTEAHAMILTISGNFTFGTDKTYGGGANLDQALRIWFSEDDDVWRTKMYMVGGTEIVYPQHIVVSATNITGIEP